MHSIILLLYKKNWNTKNLFYFFFFNKFFILSLFLGVAGGEEILGKGLTLEFPLWEEIGFISGSMSCILVDTSGALAGSAKAGSKPCSIAIYRSPCVFSS